MADLRRRPSRTTSLPPATSWACATALSTPSVTKRKRSPSRVFAGAGWVTTKIGGFDLAGRLGAVPHLLVPAVRAVDDVEQVPALDDRAGRPRSLVQYRAVLVGALEDPVVQGLAAVAEPVVETDVGAGDVAVQRHRDVDDDLGSSVSPPSRAARPAGPSSRGCRTPCRTRPTGRGSRPTGTPTAVCSRTPVSVGSSVVFSRQTSPGAPSHSKVWMISLSCSTVWKTPRKAYSPDVVPVDVAVRAARADVVLLDGHLQVARAEPLGDQVRVGGDLEQLGRGGVELADRPRRTGCRRGC